MWRRFTKCINNNKYLKAFSDSERGWAIYNGELRHNSNSSGSKYGSTYKNGDVIGVFVDMVEVKLIIKILWKKKGTLSFSKNKEFWGEAFKDPKIKTETLYAAMAPIYKDDGCILNMNIKEDWHSFLRN